jgi:imidazolonepropionase-like amidohydrolase
LGSDTALAPFLPSRESFSWMLDLSPELRELHARAARQARETTAKLARAGVTLGTGTDIWQVPAGVHMELEELVAAGLSPLEAIRAATGSSARIVGAERDLGTIAPGKFADLVLLDADPSTDVRNTRRIWAVVQNGKVVDRAAIARDYRVRP